MIWTSVLVASLGCYLLKLVGFSVPPRFLQAPRVRRIVELLPVALLSGLIVLQTFTSGHQVVLDPRAAGLGAAAVAVLLRAPFLVVVVVATAVTAGVRALG